MIYEALGMPVEMLHVTLAIRRTSSWIVLYPLPLRDTLLRAAQQNLYAPRWSARILDEVERNLVEGRA
jgi:hypothetical protein